MAYIFPLRPPNEKVGHGTRELAKGTSVYRNRDKVFNVLVM